MSAPAGKHYTVLIVDDNPELLTLITESLTLLGDYTVLTAEDGALGLERAVELRPDCLVIDIKMPGLDGYQLVRAVRGDPATASIPLVMLTALPQEKYRLAGLLVGADQHLTKPTKPADLVAAIQAAIDLSVAERARRMDGLAREASEDPHENT
ncbi:MAG TPA: response regulator [Ktedonobacterales bacterium]|jgi:CheY-like chemotaxis protein|nr:response regulator [Ktedonobacterales bacterium]